MQFINLMLCLISYRVFIVSRNGAKALRRMFADLPLRSYMGQFILQCIFLSFYFNLNAQRQDISLNKDWLTSIGTTNTWKKVNIPHNWDDYYGYRRLIHGNLHGDAIYKKYFSVKQSKQGRRFFLFFGGVGSYASVYVND